MAHHTVQHQLPRTSISRVVLTYWNLPIVSLISPEEYSYSFLLWPNIMTATSTEQSTESSCAFLNKPPLRLRKVLWKSVAAQNYRVRCFEFEKGTIVAGADGLCFARIGGENVNLHRTISIILDSLDLYLSPTHDCGGGILDQQLAEDLMTVASL